MAGFVTELDLPLAEKEFPGITELYFTLDAKPRTFLELVSLWLGRALKRSAQ